MADALLIVFSNATADADEAKFNQWYTDGEITR